MPRSSSSSNPGTALPPPPSTSGSGSRGGGGGSNGGSRSRRGGSRNGSSGAPTSSSRPSSREQAALPRPAPGTSNNNPMHPPNPSSSSSAFPPAPPTQAAPGGYHRAPLKMPAGSRPASGRGISSSGLGTPAVVGSNLGNGNSGGGGGGGVNGSGMLARNLSPEKQRARGGGRGSRGSSTAAVGDGDVELVKARGGLDAYTPQSMASSEAFDVEDANQRIAAPKGPKRVTRRINYFTQTIVLLFIVSTSALFVWKMVALSLDDGYWGRMVNVAFLPAIIIFMLFIVHFGITQIVCALGPVAHMQTNSQFFSAIAPARALTYPDITIQMPVYKEGLEAVILPSIVSLEAAINHYRKAGGFAKIFINDDGLQLLDEKEREARVAVYRAHKIPYVARPPHSVKVRKGLFKKASNMNYCLDVSNSTTELMEQQGITDPALALSMVQEAAQGEFLAGGDLTMGSIILLVDSDTRVPEDCLTKVVGEFQECHNLGFIQCRTTPLRAEDNYWEDMIAHFTENIYDIGIALSVSGGDPAPLVGHNAFLRWEAMKAVSWREDGMTKFWSEAHVSEDFDMSLRLQTQGFIGRYATYTGAGFQEGVSLSCVDEVIRLRKYAYGACEMLLNKFKHWPCRGPITSLFWSYLGARGIPWPSKLQMAGYLGTYLAMAYSVVGICSYIVLRMFYGVLQEDITNTYDVFITVVFVFGVIGIFGAGTIRYRMGFAGDVTIFQAYWIELRNAPAMTMFWSHILWHITTACWCYFWDLDIVWGATAKESTRSTFWVEFKGTLHRYRGMYISLTLLMCVFVFGMFYTDQKWSDQRLSFPLTFYVATHLLGPFLLNPVLTRGYY